MKKIFCFSGTGNSLYAATRIASEINAEVANMKNGGECNVDVIGIVFPVYFWGLPLTVERFLGELRITNKDAYIFTVITCGGFAWGADGAVNELLKRQNVQLSYSAKLRMVRNYLPEFAVNDSKELWERADRELDKIIAALKRRDVTKISRYTALNKAMHKKYPPLKTDCGSLFTVNGCRGCEACARVCPNDNIVMKDGKPKFGSSCELCMGCVNICPANAIDYNGQTQDKKRYKNAVQSGLWDLNLGGVNKTRFEADFSLPCRECEISYVVGDYAFSFFNDGMADSSVLINDLELEINSETGLASKISGYHPYVSWQPSYLTPPEARDGGLRMKDRIDGGVIRRIKENVTTYYDKSNGWLCIGTRDCFDADCVRFCRNCVAVVKDGALAAIWVSLPTDCEVMKRLK